jgi:hypothetical protein
MATPTLSPLVGVWLGQTTRILSALQQLPGVCALWSLRQQAWSSLPTDRDGDGALLKLVPFAPQQHVLAHPNGGCPRPIPIHLSHVPYRHIQGLVLDRTRMPSTAAHAGLPLNAGLAWRHNETSTDQNSWFRAFSFKERMCHEKPPDLTGLTRELGLGKRSGGVRDTLRAKLAERGLHAEQARCVHVGLHPHTHVLITSARTLPQTNCSEQILGEGRGGLGWGRTVVGLPVFADQLVLCARVADTGAGLCLPPLTSAWTAAALRDAVLAILNDPLPYRAAADRHRRLMHAAGGAARAADVVELAAAVPQARASPSPHPEAGERP